MDPLSALSVAASVVQFVDFATGLLKDYREIHQTGQPLTFEAFTHVTNDLLQLNATMKSGTKPAKDTRSPLAEHELVSNLPWYQT
jgi:hypothetical protein